MTKPDRIRTLINRLARLDTAEIWEEALNPAQISALEYLAQANRFSRAPSHVADYLGTTRGTMSQTLKALARKGYVSERRSETDKRSISYDLTQEGYAIAARRVALLNAIDVLSHTTKAELDNGLSTLLEHRLHENGGRSFGVCSTCAHHRMTQKRAYCALLSLSLLPVEPEQICHEHEMLA